MSARRKLTAGAAVAISAGAFLIVRAAPWEAREPSDRRPATLAAPPSRYGAQPLQATPSHPSTGLRLLVSHSPAPLVVDVDTGETTPITGLPAGPDQTAHLEPTDQHHYAVVVSRRDCQVLECDPAAQVYVLRRGTTAARRLAPASDIEPARDGAGVWVLTERDATRCALGQVGFDGRPRRPARPVPCGLVLIDDTPAGLLAYGAAGRGPWTAFIAPDGALRRTREPVDGMATRYLALGTSAAKAPLTLTDLRNDARFSLPWPSRLGAAGRQIRAHPNAPLALVGFYDPDPGLGPDAGPGQAFDAWLLDTAARTWRQLPGMPARFADKPSLEWTRDGRLVILARQPRPASGDATTVIAIWRPGQPRLTVHELRLRQDRIGGFVFW